MTEDPDAPVDLAAERRRRRRGLAHHVVATRDEIEFADDVARRVFGGDPREVVARDIRRALADGSITDKPTPRIHYSFGVDPRPDAPTLAEQVWERHRRDWQAAHRRALDTSIHNLLTSSSPLLGLPYRPDLLAQVGLDVDTPTTVHTEATEDSLKWIAEWTPEITIPGWMVGRPCTEADAELLRREGYHPQPGWPPADERTVDQVDADRYRWGH